MIASTDFVFRALSSGWQFWRMGFDQSLSDKPVRFGAPLRKETAKQSLGVLTVGKRLPKLGGSPFDVCVTSGLVDEGADYSVAWRFLSRRPG